MYTRLAQRCKNWLSSRGQVGKKTGVELPISSKNPCQILRKIVLNLAQYCGRVLRMGNSNKCEPHWASLTILAFEKLVPEIIRFGLIGKSRFARVSAFSHSMYSSIIDIPRVGQPPCRLIYNTQYDRPLGANLHFPLSPIKNKFQVSIT